LFSHDCFVISCLSCIFSFLCTSVNFDDSLKFPFCLGWKLSPPKSLPWFEEQRNEMMQERQEITKQSCENKQEGDSCTFQSPRGESEGVCMLSEDQLVCKGNKGDREKR
jgi:hypothetical protein